MSKFLKGFSSGLISGALIGAAAALLYAPDKGSATRDRVSFRLSQYLEELNTLVEQLRKEKNGVTSDAKIRGDQLVEEAQEKAENLISEAEELLKTIKTTKQKAASDKEEK